MDLRKAFRKSVSEHPERKAIISEEKEYTYRELHEKVRKVAGYIEDKDLEGKKIGFSSPNYVNAFITVLGIWYSGSTCVHINPRLEIGELPYYIKDSGTEALFHHGSLSEKIGRLEADIETEKLENIRESEYESGDEDLADELCSITYTSGTTGKPKGVPYTHNRLLHGAMILVIEAQEFRDIDIEIQEEIDKMKHSGPENFSDETIEKFIESEPWEEDTHAVIYPLYHVSGTNPSFATLLGGGTLMLPDRDIENVMSRIEEYEVTLTGGVPAQLSEMCGLAEEEYDVSSLEFLHTGGGLLTDKTREKVVNSLSENLCHEYASSETLEMAYSLDNSGALGEPTFLQEIKVVKPGTLEEVSTGEKGEAVINTEGPTVFQGYWNKPEKTAESMEDGWYRTGDLVRHDEKGRLWFEGRADDLIISGGENISPATVENSIVSHPEVERAGVIGVEDDEWGQKVVAYVEGDVKPEELESYLKESDLADFKRPKEYIIRDSIPFKETSGVDRKKLREDYSQ